ncbi:MAG: Ig-like domain-containing protein [Bacteroidaceae bacterium]|nr:Ig-like domain-containing protein [Bacteroidaceae bacterium]
MKKFICITAILLQTAFLLLNSSCEDENHMKDMVASDCVYSLSFSKIDISFKSSNPQTLSVDINSYDFYDTPWRLEDIPSWITVSQTSGKGPETITIKASENKSKSPRNGTITLSSTVPYWSYSVKLNVSQEAMPEYACVDLGLSVKWATFNIGAEKPEDYGDRFAWGETSPKSNYSWSTYKYCKGSSTTMTKYCTSSSYGTVDNKTVLDLSDDAAHVNWGGSWRMPTNAEFDELLNSSNCTWTWTTMNGVNGYKVVSKKSGYAGNWIFLPAAGYRDDAVLRNVGSGGYYWSSSLYESYSYNARELFLYPDGSCTSYHYRYYGQSVRPVFPVSATGISLDKQSVEIMEGCTETLTATVRYENGGTGNTATWSSSNTGVATVDDTGKITAVSTGTCTVTATVEGFSATCTVTVKPFESEYGYVDLGLSVKWATCNVGATKPEEYGDYFAWGETSPKANYSFSTYKYCKGSYDTMTKYCDSSSFGTVDYKTVLDLSDDAAHVNWGGSWRMPTDAEFNELLNSSNCTWTWTTMNGVNGYKVVSKKSGYAGNWIFLPAAGCRDDADLRNVGSDGGYWSSSLYWSYNCYAYGLGINSGGSYTGNGYRCRGLSVRPVCK